MQTRRLHQLLGSANEVHSPDATHEEPLWVVDVGAGQLRLVQGSEALKDLIAKHALTMTTRIYELSATSKALGEIPELAATFESHRDVGPTTPDPAIKATPAEPQAALAEPQAALAEPVVAPADPAAEKEGERLVNATAIEVVAEHAEAARPNHKNANDDFSLLDRPFDGGDYFEEPPRGRWMRAAGFTAVLALLGGGGYQVLHSRSSRSSAAVGSSRESTAVTAAAPPAAEPVIVAPAPVAAPTAPAAQLAVATHDPVPASAVPAAVVAPPVPADPPSAPGVEAPSASYEELVAAGQRQFDGGRSRKAQALFEQALAERPDGTAALVGLAYVDLDQGRAQQAIPLFRRALDQDRANPLAMFGLAESHRQTGKSRDALSEFKKFLTLQSTGSNADIARRLVQELTDGRSP